MDPERYRQLNDLFLAAIDREPDRRAVFLDEACLGDPTLRAEVDSLIAAHEHAGCFLEAPAAETDAVQSRGSIADQDSLVGSRLGQYLITRRLGRGGMGVVYLADDTRLGRQVAIKALAPEFSRSDRRRERLRREARAAAALSHPGIATVYALEEFDNTLYFVTPAGRGS